MKKGFDLREYVPDGGVPNLSEVSTCIPLTFPNTHPA